MTEWRECTIADIGTIVTGKTPSTKKSEYWDGTKMFVTPKDIQTNKHIYTTERYITDNGLNVVKGSLLPAHSICVSCIGNIGYLGITTETCVSNQQINSIIVNEDNDTDFVYYLMKSLWAFFKNYEGQSTALSILNKTQFSKIKVKIPALKTQKIISSILSTFDDKIEENERINKNFSEIIQALYQEHFNIAKVSLSLGKLSDICEYSKERIAVSELTVKSYYSTENMQPNKMGVIEASGLPTSALTTKCSCGDTLVSNIRPYFKKIAYCYSECGCSADVLCFAPCKPELSAFLYSTLYSDNFFNYMIAGSKGTKMPRGDKQQIMMYPVAMPSDSELATFNEIAVPILKQININNEENSRLVALRDRLLPRLMSAELDVSDIDF